MLIIIDKIYIGIVNSFFLQICNRVMALDSCQNLVSTQYLENELTNEIKFCIFIIIDKIYIGDINHFFANLQQGYGPRLTSDFGFYSMS